jgi:hypothetical protein
MKTLALLYTFVLGACSSVAFGQHAASSEHTTLSQIEDHFVNGAEHTIVPIAEAMPEDKALGTAGGCRSCRNPLLEPLRTADRISVDERNHSPSHPLALRDAMAGRKATRLAVRTKVLAEAVVGVTARRDSLQRWVTGAQS